MFVRHVVDGEERYLIWSSVVDAPTTYGCTLEQLKNYWREEYGRRGLEDLERRIKNGDWCTPLEELVGANRAGKDETKLTSEQIVQHYFIDRKPPAPVGEDWQAIFAREEKELAAETRRRNAHNRTAAKLRPKVKP